MLPLSHVKSGERSNSMPAKPSAGSSSPSAGPTVATTSSPHALPLLPPPLSSPMGMKVLTIDPSLASDDGQATRTSPLSRQDVQEKLARTQEAVCSMPHLSLFSLFLFCFSRCSFYLLFIHSSPQLCSRLVFNISSCVDNLRSFLLGSCCFVCVFFVFFHYLFKTHFSLCLASFRSYCAAVRPSLEFPPPPHYGWPLIRAPRASSPPRVPRLPIQATLAVAAGRVSVATVP